MLYVLYLDIIIFTSGEISGEIIDDFVFWVLFCFYIVEYVGKIKE